MSLTEDDETRILLEKEFDDYYEDHVHKSAVCFDFLKVCLFTSLFNCLFTFFIGSCGFCVKNAGNDSSYLDRG